jgi:1-acyl-sn-glycerol-3-phosphate acyltransferase
LSKNKEKKQKKQKKQGSAFFRAIYACLSGVVGLLFRIKVINPENEPKDGGFVVCANHISATDPIKVCYAFRSHQVCFMAKKELFKIPVISGFLKMLGAFPVDRGGNDVGAIKKAVGIVESGKCLGVFPQGHRYPGEDPRSTKTKNGAALISAKAGATVVPVYIWCKGKKSKLFRKSYVIIGEAIPFEQFEYDKDNSGEYSRMTDIIFDKICSLGEDFEEKLLREGKKK